MQGQFSGEGLGSVFSSIPSVFLTFRSGSGTPVVLPSAWVGIISRDPVVLSAAFREGNATELPNPEGEFAVNLPDEDMIREFRRSAGGSDMSSLRFTEESLTGAPLILDCAVRIECRFSTFESRFGECYARGVVAAVHIRDRIFPIRACTDIFQVDPFVPLGHSLAEPWHSLPDLRTFPGPSIGFS